MCDWFDETCGELLGHLEKKGLRDNTIVLYVTDNGWIQRAENGRYAPRSKRSPNEGGVRTPIMVRWPGKVRQRFDEETLVSAIDVAPTILRACGLEVPKSMPGIDLRDTEALRKRNAVFGAAYAHDVHDVDKPNRSVQTRYVISGDWKMLAHHAGPVPGAAVELYNLSVDPHESKDLADQHADRVQVLRGQLDAWWPGPTAATQLR